MDMPQNQDFKYVLQDFGNIYIGARYSYEEMLKSEEIPYKWKAIIRHYLLKETSPETTMENHIFFMKEDDFAYETFQELKASFKMSVWIEAGKGISMGITKAGNTKFPKSYRVKSFTERWTRSSWKSFI